MTYAVTGYRVANSDAERSAQIFQVFDTLALAQEAASKLLSDERVKDIAVWQSHSTPKLVTTITWENAV